MTRHLRICISVVATCFIILGVIGLFLPVLQGVLFLALGAALLSIASPRFKTWLDGYMIKFPRAKRHYDKHSSRVDNYFQKKSEGREER
jgi:uncharacterized membrane protein YbaN (DUF454 family)